MVVPYHACILSFAPTLSSTKPNCRRACQLDEVSAVNVWSSLRTSALHPTRQVLHPDRLRHSRGPKVPLATPRVNMVLAAHTQCSQNI